MNQCKTISLSQAKGGVGKTTTAVNIGIVLATQGYHAAALEVIAHG